MGTLDASKMHVATCKFCLRPAQIGVHDVQLLVRDLHAHLESCPNREYKCKYCGKTGKYVDIKEVHHKVCAKVVVACTNSDCTKRMQRGRIDKHVDTKCLYTVLPCKYKGIGCATELKRQDMAAHEQDDKLHLLMTQDTVKQLQEKQSTTTFKFTEYQQKRSDLNDCESPCLYTTPSGCHVKVIVDVSQDDESDDGENMAGRGGDDSMDVSDDDDDLPTYVSFAVC